MFARYTPTGGAKLAAEATACHFAGFNWQQQVTNLPCPNEMQPADPSNFFVDQFCGYYFTGLNFVYSATPKAFTAPRSFQDPPHGGYNDPRLLGYDPYPYYYPFGVAENPGAKNPINGVDHSPLDSADPTGKTHLPAVNNTTFLAMSDTPTDPCLPPGTSLVAPFKCGLFYAAQNSYVGFTTSLVGISNDGNSNPVDLPSTSSNPTTFTWQTNYNGTAGGVSGLLSSADAPDPGSGVGYITITSINGVPVPPIIPPTQVSTTTSGLAYSRVSQTFHGTVTITNTSGTTLTTPTNFQLVLNSLPDAVTLANSMGTFNQCPYLTIPTLTSLAPGQSVTVAVQFSNPSNVTINFTPEFYAGSFQ